MNKITNEYNANKIYVGVEELQTLFSVGRNTALKIGNESGASVKIGSRRLFNVETVTNYLKSKQEKEICG